MDETFKPRRLSTLAAAQGRIAALQPDAYARTRNALDNAIGAALKAALNVRSIGEPHLAPWLTDWATCEAAPALFPSIDRRCDSFSKWWKHASRELNPAAGLLPARDIVRSEP
ncbi:MAG: hypothetical protein EOP02_09270 [Proteobacteria bacterium]|nr:MAG: hypothetical protein EOP02_09270 [Pseudomonadota bacterium]